MAKYIYPALFTEEDGMYNVSFPDLEGCYTFGDSLTDAHEMAEDVLCLWMFDLEERKADIPKASSIKSIKTNEKSVVSFVRADTIVYRKKYNNKAVKKTLSIPTWLNTMAEQENVNFSAVLQHALKDELHIVE